ncbi:MAG: hypothetical protein JWM16_706 [Verrucomicrobiales bacterium]|nr:hypothetical protein [Verrucomicrobiales bacterium]
MATSGSVPHSTYVINSTKMARVCWSLHRRSLTAHGLSSVALPSDAETSRPTTTQDTLP